MARAHLEQRQRQRGAARGLVQSAQPRRRRHAVQVRAAQRGGARLVRVHVQRLRITIITPQLAPRRRLQVQRVHGVRVVRSSAVQPQQRRGPRRTGTSMSDFAATDFTLPI